MNGPVTSGARARSFDRVSVLLLIGHAAIWLAVIVLHPPRLMADDVARFVQIATAEGIPYREVPVEYMPLETIVVQTLLGVSVGEAAVRVVAISAASDVATFLLVGRLFGVRAGRAYLWLSLPLQVFMLLRLDMIAVVLVLVALTSWRSGARGWGGAAFAAAAAFKLWPLALIPLLVWEGERRAVVVATAVVAAVAAGWLGLGGVEGIRYVMSFRDATGWQIESTIGASLALFAEQVPRFEMGAIRVGQTGSVYPWLLRAGTLLLLVAVWWRARVRPGVERAGFPAAAAVATVVALAPVASGQYVAWIVPFAAVAVAERRRVLVVIATAGACTLAASSFLVYWDIVGGVQTLEVISVVRALCIVALPVAWFLEPREGGA